MGNYLNDPELPTLATIIAGIVTVALAIALAAIT